MDYGQPARVANLLDLHRDSRRTLCRHIVAPARVIGLHQTAGPIAFQRHAIDDQVAVTDGPVGGSFTEVRRKLQPELVLCAFLRVGERLPEPFWSRLDIDLENLLHRASFQTRFDVDHRGSPRSRELRNPPVVNLRDRHRVEVMALLAPFFSRHHEAGPLKNPEVLGDTNRDMPNPASSALWLWPSLVKRASSNARRVGSASALKTSSMNNNLVTERSHVN